MRQSELCKEIAGRSAIKSSVVRKCLETFSEVLREKTLEQGESIITPFGKFNRKIALPRKCYNPRTGKSSITQETHSLSFSTRKKLKLHRMTDGAFAPIPSRNRKSTAKSK